MVVDLQARVAVIFDGWAKGMVAEGRSRELRDALVHVVGEENADTLMASLVDPAEPEPEPESEKQTESTDKRELPVQGSLF